MLFLLTTFSACSDGVSMCHFFMFPWVLQQTHFLETNNNDKQDIDDRRHFKEQMKDFDDNDDIHVVFYMMNPVSVCYRTRLADCSHTTTTSQSHSV